MAANPSTHQYEPLRVPPSWKPEERRVIQQLTDIFDDIYSWRNRLRLEDFGTAFRNKVTGIEGGISELEQTAQNISAEVSSTQIYRASSEAVLLAVLSTKGVELAVDLLWYDTTAKLGKRCTSTAPIAWEVLETNAVHTSFIDIYEDSIDIGSTGSINLSAGANFNMAAGTGKSGIGISNNRPDNIMMWAGSDTPASAPFRVLLSGAVVASKIQQEYSQSFWDMADENYPAEFPLYIPAGYTIDTVQFTFKTNKARTFAKGAASGGGQTSGSGGGGEKTSRNGGGETKTSTPSDAFTSQSPDLSTGLSEAFSSGTSSPGTNSTGTHAHTITNHRHAYTMGATYTGYEQPSSVNAGDHSHTVNSHSHNVFGHSHPIGQHVHTLNNHTHNVTVSAHTHIVDIDAHTHTIDAHTHDLDYGINEKAALATSCVLKVGSETIGTYAPNPAAPIEIKDNLSAGWNTITVAPNNDARIAAFVLVKLTPAV